jgi:hypothetical protein
MMNSNTFVAEVHTFWVAHGEGFVYHGELEPGQQVSSGLELETFTKRRPWLARVLELGGSFEQ